jgi:hypothetical protein
MRLAAILLQGGEKLEIETVETRHACAGSG